MKLGLALSPCATQRASATYDIVSSSWSGLWLPDYSGDPWTSTASAGTSGTANRSLIAGAAPPAGSAINGFVPADFNGLGHLLVAHASFKWSDLATVSQYFYELVFNADTTVASAAQPYDDPALVTDNGGNIGVNISNDGVQAWHYDGVAFRKTTKIACSTGAWHRVRVAFSGGTLSCRLDGGSPQTISAGNVTAMTTLVPRLGGNYNASASNKWTDYKVVEARFALAVPDAATLTSLATRDNTRYGVSL